MKKNNFIKAFLVLYCFLVHIAGYSQTTCDATYYVTNPGTGANSLYAILPMAIDDANLMNKNVCVYFNAPDLCSIDQPLTPIIIGSGSITLKKAPGALVEQGIKYIGTSIMGVGFNVSNSTTVTIKNLTIKDFWGNGTTNYGRNAIYLHNSNNVTIDSCVFENNRISVHYFGISNLIIQHNKFLNNNYFDIVRRQLTTNKHNYSKIKDNYFYTTNLSPSGTAISMDGAGTPINHHVQISNNHISNYQIGIWIVNHNRQNVDLTYQVEILDNILFNGSINIVFWAPFKHFKIQGNNFTTIPSVFSPHNIQINYYPSSISNVNGLDFINSNSLGYPVNNSNNTFNSSGSSSASSINIYGSNIDHRIIAQILPARIIISQGHKSTIRANQIQSNGTLHLPVDLIDGGNNHIPKPSLVKAASSGNELKVEYKVSGLNESNRNFVVDFYKSNSNGDLLDYIGNHTVQSLVSTDTATVFLSIPPGTTLNTGERMAATVTSLGNVPGNQALGTSEVAYTILTCPEAGFTAPDTICVAEAVTFVSDWTSPNTTYSWNFGNGTTGSGPTPTTSYNAIGTYTVTLQMGSCGTVSTYSQTIEVSDKGLCCINCVSSFAPTAGEYILGAWVKADDPVAITYSNVFVKIGFINSPLVYTFSPDINKNKIIDGWQRIEGKFTIPPLATEIHITLENRYRLNAYFDDIRIHPVDANMKSYTYDPVTLRLMAELDENNYATFYEYDEEGILTRVKKETERGIVTLKETRSNTVKIAP